MYLPLYVYNKEEDKLDPLFSDKERIQMVTKICDTLMNYKLIMHNGVFDVSSIYHEYAINLTRALYADTQLMKHTVDEERPFGLKDLGEIKFGEGAIEEQLALKESVIANGGRWTKKDKDMYKADMEILAEYAIKDVILTLMLYDEYLIDLEDQDLDRFFFDQEVMPLYRKATIPMKLNGVYIDLDYFENLKKEVEDGIIELTEEVFELIKDDIEPKVREILDKSVKTSRTGEFAKKVLQYYDLPVPLNKKTGKPTLAKSALRSLEADYPGHQALEWLLWTEPKEDEEETVEPSLPEDIVYTIKKEIYVERKPEYPNVFNLASTHHLSWLLFDHYGETPQKYSPKTKKPTVDKDELGKFDLPFIPTLAKLKKEEKILSTYIMPILTKQHERFIYPDMQQWGTTSGRYSCGGGLNLQTLPKKDLRIKKGFVAPAGYKVVAADFSSLEPRIFAWVSGDEGLKKVYWDELDLYSQIAIDVFGLDEYSASPNDKNYLKEVNPDMRDLVKVFTLAVPYGAGPGRIAKAMNKDYQDAKDIIEDYLDSYPNLREYMETTEEDAFELGVVYTKFGRVRHLPEAKELFDEWGWDIFKKKSKKRQRYFILKEGMNAEDAKEASTKLYLKFRNLMNNAKNFPIQGTAAHVTNASLIYLSELFEENDIDGWICLQIHDEIVTIVKEEQAELAADLLRESMENNWVAKEIDVAMIAEPLIADNFSEAKD